MINQVFGEWDAPVTDDAEHVARPVGEICLWCQEEIKEGDHGRIFVITHIDNDKSSRKVTSIEHRECALRNVLGGIGHHVNHNKYCHGELGPDAGLTRRQSSLLVWELFAGYGAALLTGLEDDVKDIYEQTIEAWRKRDRVKYQHKTNPEEWRERQQMIEEHDPLVKKDDGYKEDVKKAQREGYDWS